MIIWALSSLALLFSFIDTMAASSNLNYVLSWYIHKEEKAQVFNKYSDLCPDLDHHELVAVA